MLSIDHIGGDLALAADQYEPAAPRPSHRSARPPPEWRRWPVGGGSIDARYRSWLRFPSGRARASAPAVRRATHEHARLTAIRGTSLQP